MNAKAFAILRLIRDEAWGLFVDDPAFAAAILVWLAVAGAILPRLWFPGWALGPLLFLGLAVILVASARRSSRRR